MASKRAAYAPWLIVMLAIALVPSFLGEAHFNALSYALSHVRTPQRRELDYVRQVAASADTAKEVKIFGLSPFLIDRYRAISRDTYDASRRLAMRRAAWGVGFGALGTIAYYAAYAYIAWRAVTGSLSIGDLTFLAASFLRLRGLLEGLLTGFSATAGQALYIDDLFSFFRTVPGISSPVDALPFPHPIRQGFVFEDVGFRYPGAERWAVRHMSFTLAPGEVLALVGENGAGKTTLVKLLARLYDPVEGRVLLDGRDLRDYDLDALRDAIGVIFQDFVRYNLPAADNIAVGRIAARGDRERIEAAAAAALADGVVAKPRAARTPLLDRAVEILERINGFVDEAGSEPVSEPGRGVRERMLANELAGLRASKADLDGLASYDNHKLVFGVASGADPLDDPLLSAGLDIFEVRDELKPMARPDFVADRRPCPDFERFEPLFERVRTDVEGEKRRPQHFRQERVELSEFFVLKGQLVHVADLRDEHRRNGKPDARLRVIFDNGTESNLLMSSLVRRLYEDKDARRIGTTDVGPLFEGARTGFVYVLRSRSDKPEARGLLKVGTTSGTVEDRIARAEAQSTFLFAPVEILETYELRGHSAKEAEERIHRALQSYHVALRVTGPDGRTFSATEWFKATPALVEEAVDLALK